MGLSPRNCVRNSAHLRLQHWLFLLLRTPYLALPTFQAQLWVTTSEEPSWNLLPWAPEELSGCLLPRIVQGLAPRPFMDFLTFCSGQPCLMVMDSHFTEGEVGG